jgi:hypothetical protein
MLVIVATISWMLIVYQVHSLSHLWICLTQSWQLCCEVVTIIIAISKMKKIETLEVSKVSEAIQMSVI